MLACLLLSVVLTGLQGAEMIWKQLSTGERVARGPTDAFVSQYFFHRSDGGCRVQLPANFSLLYCCPGPAGHAAGCCEAGCSAVCRLRCAVLKHGALA